MHPAIRLVVLVVLAAALPGLSLAVLTLVACGLLAAHFLIGGPAALRQVGFGLWRLRWLLLAIVFLYAGFTRGDPFTDALPGLSREGTLEALRRSLVLADLLAAVYLLVLLTPLPDLVGALRWLSRPLRLLRLDPERLALRLGLVLEAVRSSGPGMLPGRETGRGRVLDAVAGHIRAVETGTGGPGPAVSVPELERPAFWQWSVPAALAAALFWVPL